MERCAGAFPEGSRSARYRTALALLEGRASPRGGWWCRRGTPSREGAGVGGVMETSKSPLPGRLAPHAADGAQAPSPEGAVADRRVTAHGTFPSWKALQLPLRRMVVSARYAFQEGGGGGGVMEMKVVLLPGRLGSPMRLMVRKAPSRKGQLIGRATAHGTPFPGRSKLPLRRDGGVGKVRLPGRGGVVGSWKRASPLPGARLPPSRKGQLTAGRPHMVCAPSWKA
ncbi:MAG: hypothetical protein R3E79_60280 [Caldilineaceae bacterium]